FVPGDSLTFKYPSSHDVVQVTKADYDTCSGSNPLGSYTGGSTTIKLTTAGKRYFICTTPGHCAAGMKLEVDVTSTTATTAPAPSPAAPAPKSTAPSLAPVVGPTADSTVSDLPIVSTPAPSPVPMSGAVQSTSWAHIALGLGFGLFLVLTI
ncbi:early nodulin-like protein 14, partial [Carex rostrata]